MGWHATCIPARYACKVQSCTTCLYTVQSSKGFVQCFKTSAVGRQMTDAYKLHFTGTRVCIPGLMVQVEYTRWPPGFNNCTATRSKFRWYLAVCITSAAWQLYAYSSMYQHCQDSNPCHRVSASVDYSQWLSLRLQLLVWLCVCGNAIHILCVSKHVYT